MLGTWRISQKMTSRYGTQRSKSFYTSDFFSYNAKIRFPKLYRTIKFYFIRAYLLTFQVKTTKVGVENRPYSVYEQQRESLKFWNMGLNRGWRSTSRIINVHENPNNIVPSVHSHGEQRYLSVEQRSTNTIANASNGEICLWRIILNGPNGQAL